MTLESINPYTGESNSTLVSITWIITIVLIMLSVFCLLNALLARRCMQFLRNQIHPKDFDDAHKRMLSYKEKKSDANTPVKIIKEFIGKFNELLRESKNKLFPNCPAFVKYRLGKIIFALEACERAPDNAVTLFDRSAISPISPQIPFRWFGRLLTNLLLFVGIIGTFIGLLKVFSDSGQGTSLIASLVKSAINQGELPELHKLISGFQIAFGSSLSAYIMHLAGRAMLDILDEDYDSLVGYLENELTDGLYKALSPLDVDIRVDLPEKIKDALAKIGDTFETNAQRGIEYIDELTKIAAVLGATAQSFTEYIEKIEEAFKSLEERIHSGEKAWQTASNHWTSSTNSFVDKANEMVETISKLDKDTEKITKQMKDTTICLIEEMDGSVNENIEEMKKTYTKVIKGMNSTATSITDNWDKYVKEMLSDFATNINNYHTQLNNFKDELRNVIEDYQKMREHQSQMAEMLNTGQQDLTDKIDHMASEEQTTRKRIDSHINEGQRRLEGKLEEHLNSLGEMGAIIQRMEQVFHNMEQIMVGQGTPADLLAILNRIDAHMRGGTIHNVPPVHRN
jgi:methyl-accepting chemotaxis protein